MKKLIVSVIGAVGICACAYGAEDKPVELFPVIQGGKWGYMDKSGKVAIKPEYDMAWDFSEGLASVQVGINRGYIDAQGTMVIKPQFGLSRPFSEGVAAVLTNVGPIASVILFNYGGVQWGYIDKTGKPALTMKGIGNPIRAFAGEFHDGHAAVGQQEAWMKSVRGTFVSRDGRVGTGPNISSIYVRRYSGGLAAFQQERGKWGYVNTNGVEVMSRIYEDAGDFSEGLAPVAVAVDINDPARTTTWTKAGKYNLGARNGAERAWGTNSIPMDDGDAMAFGTTKTFVFSVAAPLKQGKYNFQWQMQAGRGFGDMSSNVVVTVTNAPVAPAADAPQKDAAAPATTAASTAPAPGKRLEDGARYVSQNVPAVMTTGQTYTVSVAMKNTGPTEPKWGYIDTTGKIVIEPQFQAAREFSEGLAGVCVAKKWGYVDKTGKMAVNPQYEFANPFSEGLARVVVAGPSTSSTGSTGSPQAGSTGSPQAGSTPSASSGQAGSPQGPSTGSGRGKHGFIDKTGKMVIEPKFDYGWDFSKGLARVAVGEDVLTAKEGYIDKTGKYMWEPKESVYGTVKAVVKPESSGAK